MRSAPVHLHPRGRSQWGWPVGCVVRADGLRAGLIDGQAISWFGDWFLLSACRCQPGSFRDFRLFECFGWSVSERRTGVEVGDVGDVPSVCIAIDGTDVVVLHGTSTTSLSTCRCSTCLLPFFLQPLGDPQFDYGLPGDAKAARLSV